MKTKETRTMHTTSDNIEITYIDSAEWLKNKKATINAVNKKVDKCFQYAVTVSINHQNIKNNPE